MIDYARILIMKVMYVKVNDKDYARVDNDV